MDDFTLVIFADGTRRLERNGKPQVCPFRQPYITPGRLQNQVQITKETCNNSCPLFYSEIRKDHARTIFGGGRGEYARIFLHCSNSPVIQAEIKNIETTPAASPIIN